MNVILLDRDGTVIVDPPDEVVDKVDKIELFPDTIEALRYLAEHDFAVIMVTNQTGIAAGRMTEAEFEAINDKVMERLKPSGVSILKTFFCPHGPNDGCECRKPKPTMLLWAAKEFNLNLDETFLVGDRESDIQAGQSAGTKTVLVKTGIRPVEGSKAEYVAENLLEAVKYAISHY